LRTFSSAPPLPESGRSFTFWFGEGLSCSAEKQFLDAEKRKQAFEPLVPSGFRIYRVRMNSLRQSLWGGDEMTSRSVFAWVATIVAGIISTIAANVVWARMNPEKDWARILREVLPPAVAKLIPPPPRGTGAAPSASPAPEPAPVPTAEVKPLKPAEPSQGMIVVATPIGAPLSAQVLAPIRSGPQEVRVTLLISSRIDAQKAFVMENGKLVDWSGRVVESGATCWTGYGELKGIKSFRADGWNKPDVDLDQLPLGIASQVDTTFICDKPVSVGERFMFKARLDSVSGSDRSPIGFTSSELTIAERR
jgi:hypothetical protein